MADHLNILEGDNGDGDVVLTTPELEYSERDNGDGDVVLTTPDVVLTYHIVITFVMMHFMQINNIDEMHRRTVVGDGSGENSQLDPEHAIPTSQLLPGNIVDDQNGQSSQLDPGHENPRYGINQLLKMYAVSQAGILAASSSAKGRRGWSLFMLSGLVSAAIIVVLLLKFSQQFRKLQEEEYCRWVAQKAAIVVVLMVLSVCLLFFFTP